MLRASRRVAVLFVALLSGLPLSALTANVAHNSPLPMPERRESDPESSEQGKETVSLPSTVRPAPAHGKRRRSTSRCTAAALLLPSTPAAVHILGGYVEAQRSHLPRRTPPDPHDHA